MYGVWAYMDMKYKSVEEIKRIVIEIARNALYKLYETDLLDDKIDSWILLDIMEEANPKYMFSWMKEQALQILRYMLIDLGKEIINY